MDESQGLFEEENHQPGGHFVFIEFIFVHIRFLSESECGMLEAYR